MGMKAGDAALVKLTKDYQANMAALRNDTLNAGKFAWQVHKDPCCAFLV